MTAENWFEQAKCKDMPTLTRDLIFYPEMPVGRPYKTTQHTEYQAAKAYCRGDNPCPVADQCLAYALEMDDGEGAWGGYSPAERMAMRETPLIKCPVCQKLFLSTSRNRTLCGGEECMAERQRQRQKKYRRNRTSVPSLAADDPRHGTANGYRNYGCRCEPCRGAATYRQAQTRRKAS